MITSTKSSTVTKKQLINAISQDKGLHPNEVRNVVQAFLDKIVKGLSKGERFELRGFGVLKVVYRQKKIGRNPKNPTESIEIPATYRVKFSSGKELCKKIAMNMHS